MKPTKPITFKLSQGEVKGTEQELSIIPGESSSRTYLWIGDDDNGCYATLSGVKTLEKLAMSILRNIGHKVTLS